MAQRLQVLLVCDIHDDDTPGTSTVSFALDGATYEIDLCDQHAAAMREDFAPYVAAGRRSGRSMRSSSSGRRRGHRTSGVDPAAVRAWARSNHVKVSERGRISADVLERYAASKK
jgi:hypothetical protein